VKRSEVAIVLIVLIIILVVGLKVAPLFFFPGQ
jgi:hypothetical protein